MTARRLLLAAMTLAVATTAGCGNQQDYVLRMRVPDADGLRKDQDVKIDGVRAGTVTAVTIDRADRAEITMHLQPGAAPVGANATGRIRSVSVLGEKYVDLAPDRGGTPAPSGSWLKPAKQPVPVELDDVLNTLDAPTRTRLRILLIEGGVGLTGRGDDVRELLRVLPRGMDQVGQLINDASVDNAALRRVVEAGDRVIASLAVNRGGLTRLVDKASSAFATTAERRGSLGQAVAAAPATLAQLRGSLQRLQRTAAAIQPAADRITSAAPPLQQALRALPGFAHDAVPALHAAQDAAPDLSRLALAATPAVKHLNPVAAKAADTLQHAYPLVRDLDRGLADDALYFMQTWARVTQRSDGLGHLFGAQIVISEDTVRQIVDRVASNLTVGKVRKRAPRPRQTATARPATQVAPVVKPVLPVVKQTVCKVIDHVISSAGDIVQKLRHPAPSEPPRDPHGCAKTAPGTPANGASTPVDPQNNPVAATIGRVTGDKDRNSDSAVSALVDYLFGS